MLGWIWSCIEDRATQHNTTQMSCTNQYQEHCVFRLVLLQTQLYVCTLPDYKQIRVSLSKCSLYSSTTVGWTLSQQRRESRQANHRGSVTAYIYIYMSMLCAKFEFGPSFLQSLDWWYVQYIWGFCSPRSQALLPRNRFTYDLWSPGKKACTWSCEAIHSRASIASSYSTAHYLSDYSCHKWTHLFSGGGRSNLKWFVAELECFLS